VRSFLLGTAALDVAALVAVLLAVGRRPGAELGPAARALVAGTVAQAGHFAEELATGFHVRFPALLGLEAWPPSLFAGFNLAWLALWLAAAARLRRGGRAALFAGWFFALAAIGNGVAHPLLALVARGYFPGLLTAPLVGVLGIVVWRRLWRAT
jgi:hypothetical protein